MTNIIVATLALIAYALSVHVRRPVLHAAAGCMGLIVASGALHAGAYGSAFAWAFTGFFVAFGGRGRS